jgi:hypothetical protein
MKDEDILREVRTIAFTNQAALNGHSPDRIVAALEQYHPQFEVRAARIAELAENLPKLVNAPNS